MSLTQLIETMYNIYKVEFQTPTTKKKIDLDQKLFKMSWR